MTYQPKHRREPTAVEEGDARVEEVIYAAFCNTYELDPESQEAARQFEEWYSQYEPFSPEPAEDHR
jgi:hypothetical protein